MCCKKLIFINVPNSVFGDPSKHSSPDTNPSLFTFTFILSSAPSVGIMIYPKLFFLNGSTEVAANSVPNSFNIGSSYSNQQLSFYIQTSASTTGQFNLNLMIDGMSSSEFQETSVPLTMIASAGVLSALKIQTSRISDGGTTLIILFNVPTDYAGISANTWNCDELFSFPFSSTSLCSWVNSSAVVSTIPVYSTIIPGNNITLLGNLIKAQCAANTNCDLNEAAITQSTVLLPPFNPIFPQVQIASVTIASCDNLLIDATRSCGSAGRSYSLISWTVSSPDQNNSAFKISSYLNSISTIDQVINVPNSLLCSGTYVISLTLENWLESIDTSSTTIMILENKYSPTISILGYKNIDLPPNNRLFVQATASQSQCGNISAILKYSW
jgi:hypothetical protein